VLLTDGVAERRVEAGRPTPWPGSRRPLRRGSGGPRRAGRRACCATRKIPPATIRGQTPRVLVDGRESHRNHRETVHTNTA
jgi:hypothetical protein